MQTSYNGCEAVQDAKSNHVYIYCGGVCVCHMVAEGRMRAEDLHEAIDCYLAIGGTMRKEAMRHALREVRCV